MGQRLALILTLALAQPTLAAECMPNAIDLRAPDGTESRYLVELADTQAERAIGLMGRKSMAANRGMLFIYPRENAVSFWMENTHIPLDMLFIDASGTVQRVFAKAKPHDRTPIPGGDAVQFVVELNGGAAEKSGITVGTVMRHPRVDQTLAAWRCAP